MDENFRILLKVAQLYYKENLTQQEIAKNLRISRPKVSRLLQQAREQHIVQINIFPPAEDFTELENELEKKFGLREVIVTRVDNIDQRASVLLELGTAASKYLHRIIQDEDLIGFTWGETLSTMANLVNQENKMNISILQMVGGLGDPDKDIHVVDIVRRVAVSMNAKMILLPAPGIVETDEAHKILLADKSIKQALDLAPKVDIAFAGIGVPGLSSMIVTGNIMSKDEMQRLIDLGAVGDIGLRFFDIEGNPILFDVENRVIGASLATFRKIPHSVGVAGGHDKLNAILGAIRGKYINTLITDHFTAQQLLAETPYIAKVNNSAEGHILQRR